MSNRDRAEAAGWRLDEVCECDVPRVAWGGGDGYIIPSGCWRCRRRARHIAVEPVPGEPYELTDPKHPDFHSVHADIWDAREGK
jgi:hypothetical protein